MQQAAFWIPATPLWPSRQLYQITSLASLVLLSKKYGQGKLVTTAHRQASFEAGLEPTRRHTMPLPRKDLTSLKTSYRASGGSSAEYMLL